MTLFDMKEKLAMLATQIAEESSWIASKAADPSVAMEDITAKAAHRDELVERKRHLQEQHDAAEQAHLDSLKNTVVVTGDPEEDLIAKKAAFYKAALTSGDVSKVYEGLGAIPVNTADLGYGENLLPTNMETEIITEPFEDNSLREIEQMSQITGLEEPKLAFDIEDVDLADVTDQETAREIKMTGDVVSYGRYKTKITATVKDTVLHGTATNLVASIENALKSGLAIKEKMRAFNTVPDGVHDHMSYYLKPGIVAIPGDNIIDAIIKALGDLPDAFGQGASVVMRRNDYYAAIQKLANNAATLWGMKPEDVIGYPVKFNDRAVVPVVGNFRYTRTNYDIGAIFETDKDARKGEYYFVLTAWGDHQIKLASAFRTAYVRVQIIGAATDVAAVVEGGDVEVTGFTYNDGGVGAGGSKTYLWQSFVSGEWTDLTAGHTGYNTNKLTTKSGDTSVRCKVTFTDDDGQSFVYTKAVDVTAS